MKYLYIQAIGHLKDEEPVRFRHAFVEADDETGAYDAGHEKDDENCLSDPDPSANETRLNDYVVPVPTVAALDLVEKLYSKAQWMGSAIELNHGISADKLEEQAQEILDADGRLERAEKERQS